MSSDRERPMREQLVEARARIVTQLGELTSPHYYAPLDNHELVATLQAELSEIDQLLGVSEDDNA